ncbi:leucyl aminopeptidase family protein [Romeria aff. gracilis LEGE 07310]|uniref:Probable cytosol aminopeptidase n=1 Tax=Vasconcelosia minhoensis LEGE 07310 TaxID=915328 RepID=A0A8J7AUH2_9CYAN|nr:leucyl aminopeptidase family protein [Romeria gracilis]MBE9076953.1 leucyl aminopeptidase family protein [Romeria aff. gracilis LEGE 07310]
MPAAIPLYLVDETQIKRDYDDQSTWLNMSGFTGKAGTHCLIPNGSGGLEKVLVGKPEPLDIWTLGGAAQSLPPQTYRLADSLSADVATRLCLGWQLGQYRFDRYKQADSQPLPELIFPEQADQDYIAAATQATFLVRDLINTPASDMGPGQLEAAACQLALSHGAVCQVIAGEDLLAQQYPMIYAVGKANEQPPRLIDIHWGAPDAPKVTLVGKGVCFDTGGVNAKSASGMKLMKKDMGGAAQVLGLASLIMQQGLAVRLRVLVPAVENSIGGNAMRPSDVLTSRKGITVEVGNTDAEGRLVLADALWEASSETPQLLIDCATLTGAARVAVGAELPAFFCNDQAMAEALQQAGLAVDDPLWQLPLHSPYRAMLDSKIADISNISNSSYGGAITAALFLQEFTQPDIAWIHVDFMAYNTRNLPGRPEGGEAMGLRSLFALIKDRVAA